MTLRSTKARRMSALAMVFVVVRSVKVLMPSRKPSS
jgi:hypothetical protein